LKKNSSEEENKDDTKSEVGQLSEKSEDKYNKSQGCIDNKYQSFAVLRWDIALSKMKQQYQWVGYYWIAIPL